MPQGEPGFIPPFPSTASATPHRSSMSRTPYHDPRGLLPSHAWPENHDPEPYVYHTPSMSAAGTPFIPQTPDLPQNTPHVMQGGTFSSDYIRGNHPANGHPANRSPGSESVGSWGSPGSSAGSHTPASRSNAAGPLPPPSTPYQPFGQVSPTAFPPPPPPTAAAPATPYAAAPTNIHPAAHPFGPNPYAAYGPGTPFTPYGVQSPWNAPPPAPSSHAYTPWSSGPAALPGPWGAQQQQQQQQQQPQGYPPTMSPWGQPPPGQYTPFMPPPAPPAWTNQPGPWNPQQAPPGPWGQIPAPAPPPQPAAMDRTAGRPLMKANQAPVGDRVPKWSEGSHYGPVLSSAQAEALRVQFEINPLLIPPSDSATEYLKWDMVFETSYAFLTTDPANVSWQRGRDQPATFPRVKSLRLVSRTLPYTIDVNTADPSRGVTCGEVIEKLGRALHEKVPQTDFVGRLPPEKQNIVAQCYHRNRSREPDVPGGRLGNGMLRLDMLGRLSMFGGIRVDPGFVKEVCGAVMPATFELVCDRKLLSSEKELEDRLAAATAAAANLSVHSHSRPPSANSGGSGRSHSRRRSTSSRNVHVTVQSPSDSGS